MKFNKLFALGVVALSAVVLSGCTKEKQTAGSELKSDEKIAVAMEAGKPIHCTMTGPNGEVIETWTKDKKTKVHGMKVDEEDSVGYVINDGEWTYIWTEGSTKGTKVPVMDEGDLEKYKTESEPAMPDTTEFDAQKELDKTQEKGFKRECRQQNIPDSTFVPPADVEFVNLMDQMKAGFEKMNQGLEKAGGDLEEARGKLQEMGKTLEDFK